MMQETFEDEVIEMTQDIVEVMDLCEFTTEHRKAVSEKLYDLYKGASHDI